MGAQIRGLGSSTIHIDGVNTLTPTDFTVIPDRIEAATFLTAGLISGGEIVATNCNPAHIEEVLVKLRAAGAEIVTEKDSITLKASGNIHPTDVTTDVYPGYPTDMQAQWIALMSLAEGDSTVTDTIYADRFTHVPELRRLGANVERIGNRAFIKGGAILRGAPVMSTDLRASASLVLAALAAEGTTEIQRIYHIDRGYERIEVKLRELGARIKRVNDGRLY